MQALPMETEPSYDDIGFNSLPRDRRGFIDERALLKYCGKARLPIDSLYEIYPYEFTFYMEGYFEAEREYFEYFNYSLFSSIRQALNSKTKQFKNPFEKPKEEPIQRRLTEEEYKSELEAIKSIANL